MSSGTIKGTMYVKLTAEDLPELQMKLNRDDLSQIQKVFVRHLPKDFLTTKKNIKVTIKGNISFTIDDSKSKSKEPWMPLAYYMR